MTSSPAAPRRVRRPSALFTNRSIQTKILLVVGLLAAVCVGGTTYAVAEMRFVGGLTAELAELQKNVAEPRAVVHQGQVKARLIVAQVAATDNENDQRRWLDQQEANDAELAAAAAVLNVTPFAEESESWKKFWKGYREWAEVRDLKLLPAARADDLAAFQDLESGVSGPMVDAYLVHLDSFADEITAHMERTAAAADAEATKAGVYLSGATAAILAVSVLLAVGMARSVRRSVLEVQRSVQAMSAGDFTRVPHVRQRDEVGRMAVQLAAAQESVRATLAGVVEASAAVAAASEELAAASDQVSSGAEETSVQAGVLAASAEQVSRNVQAVAAGTEQMGSSIREIAQNAAEAAKVAQAATGAATTANDTVSRLGASSTEIGNVVKLITQIAEQTNLLALNATIEAARAGEAGKGFAVVASEVKELAQETARATDDIARRVEAIQADTTGAVESIGEITSIIASINDYQLTIASAVEEQTATTNEMARGVTEAASGSGEIASSIVGVATSAQSSSQVVGQMNQSVTELARLAEDLRGRVATFVY